MFEVNVLLGNYNLAENLTVALRRIFCILKQLPDPAYGCFLTLAQAVFDAILKFMSKLSVATLEFSTKVENAKDLSKYFLHFP